MLYRHCRIIHRYLYLREKYPFFLLSYDCSNLILLPTKLQNRITQQSRAALRSTSMSFRRRNVAISGEPTRNPPSSSTPALSRSPDHWEPQTSAPTIVSIPGVRPSALDGRPTTSTGTASLDSLLSGHALGTSILLEETGTTDYAGTLLRYYAAEGVVQGHQVHVVGVGEQWGRELPGLLGEDQSEKIKFQESEKMKIAWRYEKLGEFGAGTSSPGLRGGTPPYRRCILYIDRANANHRPNITHVHCAYANQVCSTHSRSHPNPVHTRDTERCTRAILPLF